MSKEKYFILLSKHGDFLKSLGTDIWRATFDFDEATLFNTEEEAQEYLFDLMIRSIWPQAKVESILI